MFGRLQVEAKRSLPYCYLGSQRLCFVNGRYRVLEQLYAQIRPVGI